MAYHPMFLEYEWTSNTYRSHLCGAFTSIARSFETWPPRATHCALSVYGSS
jgi:hypothetical protein